jgi:hypothetical protein
VKFSKNHINTGWNWVRFKKSIFFWGQKLEVRRQTSSSDECRVKSPDSELGAMGVPSVAEMHFNVCMLFDDSRPVGQ